MIGVTDGAEGSVKPLGSSSDEDFGLHTRPICCYGSILISCFLPGALKWSVPFQGLVRAVVPSQPRCLSLWGEGQPRPLSCVILSTCVFFAGSVAVGFSKNFVIFSKN